MSIHNTFFKLTIHFGWKAICDYEGQMQMRFSEYQLYKNPSKLLFWGLKYGVLQNSTLNTDICNKLDFCQPQLSKSSLCIALSLLSTKNVNHIYNLDLQLDNIIEPCVPIKILALTIKLDMG